MPAFNGSFLLNNKQVLVLQHVFYHVYNNGPISWQGSLQRQDCHFLNQSQSESSVCGIYKWLSLICKLFSCLWPSVYPCYTTHLLPTINHVCISWSVTITITPQPLCNAKMTPVPVKYYYRYYHIHLFKQYICQPFAVSKIHWCHCHPENYLLWHCNNILLAFAYVVTNCKIIKTTCLYGIFIS